MVLAAYSNIRLIAYTVIDMMYILLGSLAAFINKGTAAKIAISIPIKCVIALPGSLMCDLIASAILLPPETKILID